MKFQFQIFDSFLMSDFFQFDFLDIFRKKTHDERNEIEIEKIEKFSERNKKKRVDLICNRVCFDQIFRIAIKMFEQILKKIIEQIE